MTWTELHHNCEHGNFFEIIERCKTHPEEATQVDDHGSTPLHVFFWMNSLVGEMCKKALIKLVACNPDAFMAKDTNGDTPLHVAFYLNRNMTEVYDLDFPAKAAEIANLEGQYLIHMACRYNPSCLELIKRLIELNPNALQVKTRVGQLSNRSTAYKRYVDTEVPSPMEPPVDPSSSLSNNEPRQRYLHFIMDGMVHYSSSMGYNMRFSDRVTNQTRDGAYPIHLALGHQECNTHLVEILLQACPDSINFKDKAGQTPLHVALLQKNVSLEVIKMLTLLKPDLLLTKDNNENVPLHIACRTGVSFNVIKFLSEANEKSISALNKEGLHPVEVLAASHKQGYEEACRWMAVHKWNLHVDDSNVF